MGFRIGRSLSCHVACCLLLAPGAQACLSQEPSADPIVTSTFSEHEAFEAVTVKPSSEGEAAEWGIGIRGRRFWAVHVTVYELIGWAYGFNAHQVERAPAWFAVERFDVEGMPALDFQPTRDQYRTMLRGVLSERFAMKFHTSQRLLAIFALSIASGGLKISAPVDQAGKPSWGVHRGWLQIRNMTFANVAQVMQRTIFERPVLDMTGQSKLYSFTLRWRADETQFSQMQGVEVPEEPGMAERDDIVTAARQQLGIKIEAKKMLAPTIVIDTVSRPTPN